CLMVCVRCCCWAAAICDCAVAVRGVAAVSLLLLPPCADGELVCAEGCRQVTGVMAMMMTGRVLLVCALCVLWCGACCGGCDEAPQSSASGPGVGGTGGGPDQRSQESGSSPPGEAGTKLLNQTASGGASQSPSPLPPPPLPPARPPLPADTPSGPKGLPKPAELGEPAILDRTTETQVAERSPTQTRLPAEGSQTISKPTDGDAAGGKAASLDENDSGQSEGAAREQELNQTDVSETQRTATATVTGVPPSEEQENSTEENHLGPPEGEDEGTQESKPPDRNETETPS
ncbi:mucin-associated surface protein (MASP), putative, partial [Trypanosoma cruzi marinkellei]